MNSGRQIHYQKSLYNATSCRMNEVATKREKTRFDRIMIAIWGGIVICIAWAIFNESVLQYPTFGGEEVLDTFICAAVALWGVCCIFPQVIGSKTKKSLKQLFSWATWPIKKSRPEGGYWENKYFLAAVYFAFAALEYHGVSTADEEMPDWKYAILCVGFVGFMFGGFFVLLPKTMSALGKVTLWIVGIAICCALLYAAAQAVGAMSVPTAIIIGAIIIACAVNSKK